MSLHNNQFMNSNIIIAKPCHENWNNMTPEQQGRHCGACNKVVQDFTKMKTEEIIDTLKRSEGEVCGRIGIQKLTPVNKKQRIWFWMNGVLFRKAIYPVMVLLGVTLVTKKAQAQTGSDYPVKGKMDVRDYHTNDKKVNVVVKDRNGIAIQNATIQIVSGLTTESKNMITDSNGRTTFDIAASDLLNNEIEINVAAAGYENRILKITLVKHIQTVEIRMEEEMMIMGEMMYVPDEKIEEVKTPVVDTIPKIEVCKYDLKDIKDLQLINRIEPIEDRIIDRPEDIDTNATIEKINESSFLTAEFILFPNPSMDFVTIEYKGKENFNVDIFDGNGKKTHSIMNANQRYLLDLTRYASGTYYALITIEGKTVETKKIIVTR
jgi:hypothetical protein